MTEAIDSGIDRWLYPTPRGLYCEPGGFFIDPPVAVDRAIITHGHSDHARGGHGAVLATSETLDIMKVRLGEHCDPGDALRHGHRRRHLRRQLRPRVGRPHESPDLGQHRLPRNLRRLLPLLAGERLGVIGRRNHLRRDFGGLCRLPGDVHIGLL